MKDSKLICGAAKETINPELPTHMVGYGENHIATGIHDDLHVAVLYLKDDHEQFVVLTYDLETTGLEFIEMVQTACAKATGLPEKRFLLTISHNHSSPLVSKFRSWNKSFNKMYKEFAQECRHPHKRQRPVETPVLVFQGRAHPKSFRLKIINIPVIARSYRI